jgi:hypothetical protein
MGVSGEEQLFYVLLSVLHGRVHSLRSVFTDDCVGLRLMLEVLDRSLEVLDPTLHLHLQAHALDPSLYATHWFVCTFAYRFPHDFTSAAWEQFVRHGHTYLLQLGLMLLIHSRAALLDKRFEALVDFLTHMPQLPSDLPERAVVEIHVPPHLLEALHGPKQTKSTSFKQRKT